jgi:hypothetical protein
MEREENLINMGKKYLLEFGEMARKKVQDKFYND